jgi:sulfide dehydrogenase cytochrome subunit
MILLTLPGFLAADELTLLVQECETCHGVQGASTHSDIPVIGGQSVTLIEKALKQFRNFDRPCKRTAPRSGDAMNSKTNMCDIADKLDDATTKAISEHFASMDFVPALQDFDQSLAVEGANLHQLYCVTCHLEGGSKPGFGGRLAGQWKPYLKRSIGQIRSGEWIVPKLMERKMTEFTEGEIDALLDYYASQQNR